MHGHGIGAHSSHGPEETTHQTESSDVESNGKEAAFTFDESVLAQMVGVGILEFGVILHRCVKILLMLNDDVLMFGFQAYSLD